MATASIVYPAPCQRSPSAENHVRRIVAVVRGIESGRAVAAGRERRGSDHLRARRRTKRLHADAMIAMGVRDEDGLDPLAVNRGEQRGEMRIVVGARIDNRDPPLAHDIGAGAVEGEGRGVRRHQAAHHRRKLGQSARGRLARGNEKVGLALVVGHRLLFAFPFATSRLAVLS